MSSVILDTDSYKISHYADYPPGTECVFSYFEARKGAKFPYTVFFGLTPLVKRLAKRITKEEVYEAKEIVDKHLGKGVFNLDGWLYIVNEKDGRLPLRIRAVEEGAVVPVDNVLMTVVNTDPKCAWLTNYVETMLSRIWYPTTVATLSFWVKQKLRQYLVDTGCKNIEGVLPFMLHDFGSRGVSSQESAALGGAAHLVNFKGSDTVTALDFIRENYEYDVAGYSIPATEHSVMTAEGESGEESVFSRLLDNHPEGLLSVVCDSYDYEKCIIELICGKFKERILSRNGTLVIRPDSITRVNDTPAKVVLFTLRQLWSEFGGSHNDTGHKVLNPKVRIIWGDGLSPEGIVDILEVAKQDGFAAENMVFGMGGGLLQKVDRDTQRFAFKCSAQYRGGAWHDVYKKPQDESKSSKRGLLDLIVDNGIFRTVNVDSLEPSNESYLVTYYKTTIKNNHNFVIYFPKTFENIRRNTELYRFI